MRGMLAVRERLGRFYGEHDTILRWIFKFMLALAAFYAIRTVLGQTAVLNNMGILVALAAACTFLPSNAIVIAGTGLCIAHFYGLSPEAALVGGGMLVIALLLYFSIAPQSALPLILTALGTGLGFGCVPAVLSGLLGGPLNAVGAAFGAMGYYLIRAIAASGGDLVSTAPEAAEAMVQRMAQLIGAVFSEKEIPVMMAALFLAALAVYFLRIREIRYAWALAALLGTLVYLAVRICLSAALELTLPWLPMLGEAGLSVAGGLAVQVFLYDLDYRKTRTVRFEDDDFYYYVKAVPKQKIRRRKRRRRSEGRQG